MGSFTIDDFIGQANQQLREFDQHLRNFQQLDADNQAKQRDLQARLDSAYEQFGAALLPDMTEDSFNSLATQLGMPEISAAYREMLRREQQLQERIAAIEQSPAYRERESQRYRLETQLNEVEPSFRFAQEDYERLRSMPRFLEMLERGYGTAQYPHRTFLRFFNPQFLGDWKRADEIVEALGAASFDEVRARYYERREQTEVLGRTVSELRAGLQSIEAMEQELAQLYTEREQLPSRTRRKVTQLVVPLLIKNQNMADSLPNAETMRTRALAIDGMEHQIQYLEEVRQKMQQDIGQILERKNKLLEEKRRYESNPYKYRNKRFNDDQFYKRFARNDRYPRMYDRYRRTNDTIYVFNDYYRVSPLEEFLWWDVMTDGRIDGNFIPEVNQYYAQNPMYHYERPDMSYGDSSAFSDDVS